MDYADWLCTGLAALLAAKPSEIELLLRDQLEPTRAEELLRQMQAAGLRYLTGLAVQRHQRTHKREERR
jgi:hypothetical protein